MLIIDQQTLKAIKSQIAMRMREGQMTITTRALNIFDLSLLNTMSSDLCLIVGIGSRKQQAVAGIAGQLDSTLMLKLLNNRKDNVFEVLVLLGGSQAGQQERQCLQKIDIQPLLAHLSVQFPPIGPSLLTFSSSPNCRHTSSQHTKKKITQRQNSFHQL